MHGEMIIRITKYYRILHKLKSLGLERVFANNLGDAAGVNATIVRKDFSLLKIIGQKRGGYEIDKLISSLDKILGKDKPQRAIIVGCGRIGGALMRYRGFASDGISITAGFDINSHICEEDECPIPVYPMNRLEEIIKAKDIQVAILTVPEQEASELFSRLSRAGIRGYLNFTPIGLKASKEDHDRPFIIHNVNIALELEQIFYELNISDTDLV
ncbi:MAG: redox-sensing transcriptional repressor Rex [Spirochaetia bacterium]|nr:redox-sensing transcriptional repressor Rex [Spirochaetia bacterium]MCF7942169.1 redox-sensing transcriptional repressor Rex [Spirochaetia bacterium]